MVTTLQRLVLGTVVFLALAAPAGAAEVARIDGWKLDARDTERAGFCMRPSDRDSEFGGGGYGTCGQ